MQVLYTSLCVDGDLHPYFATAYSSHIGKRGWTQIFIKDATHVQHFVEFRQLERDTDSNWRHQRKMIGRNDRFMFCLFFSLAAEFLIDKLKSLCCHYKLQSQQNPEPIKAVACKFFNSNPFL